MVLDLAPTNGAANFNATNFEGVSWIDICDALSSPSCAATGNTNYESLRLNILASGETTIGNSFGGTGAVHNLDIQPAGGSVIIGKDLNLVTSTDLLSLYSSGNTTSSLSMGNFDLNAGDTAASFAMYFGNNSGTTLGSITVPGRYNTSGNGPGSLTINDSVGVWLQYNGANVLQTTSSGPTLSGNVGVGTTTPYSRLDIWGPDTASTSAFLVANNASTTEFNVLDNGNATLAGTLTQNSDERLKINIQSLNGSSSLSLIDQLNPVTFNWIDPNKGTTPQLGFIAQQVQPIFPNLVSTTSATALTPDGTLSLNYIDLISPIVSAIQALSADITSIENTIAGFANSFTTNQLTFVRGQGAEIDVQTANVQTLCIGSTCITEAQLQALLASAGQAGAADASSGGSPSGNTEATSTAPVLQINGDNPAVVQVGAAYNDLGATITGPQSNLNSASRPSSTVPQ